MTIKAIKTEQSEIEPQLVAAKSRVAPLSLVTIPRLELLAAVLAVNLSQRLITALNLPAELVHYWSDSQIVLAWIQGNSRKQSFCC